MKMKQYRAMSNLDVRSDTDEKVIEGYFVVYDTPTQLWSGYYEQIDRNAFNDCLDNDIRALFDHDSSKVLGRTKSKTLTIKSDEKGLYGAIKLNQNDTEAMNLYERVKRGDIDQCSFGFFIEDSDIETRNDGGYIETIKRANLLEVSVVTFPAYESTSVSARKQEFEEDKKRQLKAWKLRQKEKLDNVKDITN